MAGLHFDITADNTSFIHQMEEIRKSVENASNVINNLGGKGFDISTPESKILALSNAIKNNEIVINRWAAQIKQWSEDAREAFNNNEIGTFNTITKDIEENQAKIAELSKETQYVRTVVSCWQRN